mgnify:CR=1 FL=1
MEHLRFCGSLNIACGYAGEQGFCTLTRCPVVLDEFQAMRRHQGPTGQHDEVNVQGLRSAHCVDQNGGREIHALRCGAGAVQGPGGRGG